MAVEETEIKKGFQMPPFVNTYFQEAKVNSTGRRLIWFIIDAFLELKDTASSEINGIAVITAHKIRAARMADPENASLLELLIFVPCFLPITTILHHRMLYSPAY